MPEKIDKISDEFCPLMQKACRHCSKRRRFQEFTKIKKHQITGLFYPDGRGQIEVIIGMYCNDAGKNIEDMNFCPIRWDHMKKGQVWKVVRESPEDIGRIENIGQQKLNLW